MPIILDGTTGITTPGITNTGEFVFQGPIQVPAGSAASASITTAAGPDTGIYFPSSSSIAITTAGTEKVSVGTGLVINDGGADFDTRIEGDTDANLFFVDASTDRIGVGTASPSTKLHVVGTINTEEAISFGASYLGNATDYYDSRYLTSRVFNVPTGSGFTFAINNGDKLTLDSSGNLGLGVTPPAWESGTQSFNVGAGTALWNPGSGTVTRLITNAFRPTAGNYTYRNNGSASYYEQSGATHAWYNAPSGTAGDPITFTERARITSGGAIWLGVTSLPSGATAVDTGSIFINSNCYIGNTSGTAGYAFRWDGFQDEMYGVWQNASGADQGGVKLTYGNTSWSSYSDIRGKKIIENIENAVDKLSRLRTVIGRYNHDDESKRRSFLIAQDVQAVFPEAVSSSKNMNTDEERLWLNYQDLIPVLIKAVQELKAELDALKGSN